MLETRHGEQSITAEENRNANAHNKRTVSAMGSQRVVNRRATNNTFTSRQPCYKVQPGTSNPPQVAQRICLLPSPPAVPSGGVGYRITVRRPPRPHAFFDMPADAQASKAAARTQAVQRCLLLTLFTAACHADAAATARHAMLFSFSMFIILLIIFRLI